MLRALILFDSEAQLVFPVHLANVFLEIEVPAESLAAQLARVRLVFVVGVHVEGEVVHLVEGFRANVAFERLLARVR